MQQKSARSNTIISEADGCRVFIVVSARWSMFSLKGREIRKKKMRERKREEEKSERKREIVSNGSNGAWVLVWRFCSFLFLFFFPFEHILFLSFQKRK